MTLNGKPVKIEEESGLFVQALIKEKKLETWIVAVMNQQTIECIYAENGNRENCSSKIKRC